MKTLFYASTFRCDETKYVVLYWIKAAVKQLTLKTCKEELRLQQAIKDD